jgi:hypothetical protein
MLAVPDLISALGGSTRVAAACGVQPTAVSNWVARGAVAAEHRVRVWRLATEAGLDWTPPGAEGLRLVVCAGAAPVEEAA